MLLKEIMAVENFLAFKKLMVKRNRELNEETMQLMAAQEAGIDPNLLYQSVGNEYNTGYGGYDEDPEMAAAIQASLAESSDSAPSPAPEPTADTTDEDEMLRQALEASKQEYELYKVASAAEAPAPAEEEKKAPPPKKEPKKAPKKKPKAPEVKDVVDDLPKMKAPKSLAPIGGAKAGAGAMAAGFDIQKHAEETKKMHKKNEEKKAKELEKKTMTKEEMKERMSKLRKQRDLLLKKKQEALK